MPRVVVTFGSTSLGGFVAPPGITSVQLIGWGGGGGGGSGYWGFSYPDRDVVGAGGGGGALKDVAEVSVVPGTAYDIVIGAGGAGAGVDGYMPWRAPNGGDTLFRRSADAVVLATFRGAEGGTSAWGIGYMTTPSTVWTVWGGGPVPADGLGYTYASDGFLTHRPLPGVGGQGLTAYFSGYGHNGATSVQGFAGGAGGTPGAHAGNYKGGGPGGGGAAGPGGSGGNGGNGGKGGDASTSFATGPGTPGGSAAPNSGAGGGGGGTGGSGGYANFGAGGAGGSGHLTIVYVT